MAAIRFIAVSSLISLCLAVPAAALGMPAEQGAELLARAQAVDAKCHFLDARGKDKLSKFTARAELALANRESMDATEATMKRGHEAGAALECSAAEKEMVQQILAAAMQATGIDSKSAKLAAKPAPMATDAQPNPNAGVPMAPVVVAAAAPQTADRPAKLPMAKMPMKLATGKPLETKPVATGLGTYEKLTQAYYLARRCGGGNLGSSYQAVVAEHGRVMAAHSAAEVSSALHQAQARAETAKCS